MAYKKYDPMIKKMIIETRNPNLFPEYNIPRSTALYWINQSKVISSNFVKLKEHDEFHSLKKEVYGCFRNGRKCDSKRPNQLTRVEQERLVKLALDKKYSNMSIKSLMYYSQRAPPISY